MIFWRGWGLVVIVFVVAAFLLAGYTTAGKPVGDMSWGEVLVKWTLPILAVSVALFIAGKRMNASREMAATDPQTGEHGSVTIRNRHTMFFIPVQHWAFLLGALGLLFLVPGFRQPTSNAVHDAPPASSAQP